MVKLTVASSGSGCTYNKHDEKGKLQEGHQRRHSSDVQCTTHLECDCMHCTETALKESARSRPIDAVRHHA